MRTSKVFLSILSSAVLIVSFQNCAQSGDISLQKSDFSKLVADNPNANIGIDDGSSDDQLYTDPDNIISVPDSSADSVATDPVKEPIASEPVKGPSAVINDPNVPVKDPVKMPDSSIAKSEEEVKEEAKEVTKDTKEVAKKEDQENHKKEESVKKEDEDKNRIPAAVISEKENDDHDDMADDDSELIAGADDDGNLIGKLPDCTNLAKLSLITSFGKDIKDKKEIKNEHGMMCGKNKDHVSVNGFKGLLQLMNVKYIPELKNIRLLKHFPGVLRVKAEGIGEIENVRAWSLIDAGAVKEIERYRGVLCLSSPNVLKIKNFNGILDLKGKVDSVENFRGLLKVEGEIGHLKNFKGVLKLNGKVLKKSDLQNLAK